MQTKEIFTGDMTCKDNDRLVTMHTSNTCRSVRYKNKWHHWFLRRSISFTGEEDDDEISVWRDEGTYGIPITRERSVSDIFGVVRCTPQCYTVYTVSMDSEERSIDESA